MTEDDPAADQARQRRNKLIGRIALVVFGLLLLVYFVPLFWTTLFPVK